MNRGGYPSSDRPARSLTPPRPSSAPGAGPNASTRLNELLQACTGELVPTYHELQQAYAEALSEIARLRDENTLLSDNLIEASQ